jgi:hypothetical protein
MVRWEQILGVGLIIIGGSLFLRTLVREIINHYAPAVQTKITLELFMVVVGIFVLIIDAKSNSSSKRSIE